MVLTWYLLLLLNLSLTVQSATVYICTEPSDSRDRLVRTAEEFKYNVVTLDAFSVPGLKLLLKDAKDDVAVIIATRNALINLPASGLPDTKDHIIVAGTTSCTPKNLKKKYGAKDRNSLKPYVDSGVMIGQSDQLLKILSDLKKEDELQNKLSEWYLAKTHSIRVDNEGSVVYNVDQHANKVSMEFGELSNKLMTPAGAPVIVKSIGTPIGLKFLDEVGNYVGNSITKTQCNVCTKADITKDYPTVFIGILLEKSVPFLRSVLNSLTSLDYPKDKISVLIVSLVDSNARYLDEWLETVSGFNDLDVVDSHGDFEEDEADVRQTMLSRFTKSSAQYYLYIDSEVHFHPSGLKELVMRNKTLISPLVRLDNGTAWSNFWGGYSGAWAYKRSTDYANIFHKAVKGQWTVPCVRNVYLMRRDLALYMEPLELYDNDLDPDVSFCKTMVESRRFMWLTNEVEFGWLKQSQNVTEALVPDLALREEYVRDWNNQFILQAPTVFRAVTECPHVYRKQLFTNAFTKDLIAESESIKKWKRVDSFMPAMRLGRSAMNDSVVGSLSEHTTPYVQALFPGNYTAQGTWYDGLVFKVTPDELDKIRLDNGHTAAYHALVPLNQPGESLSNVGYKFHRYNCTITDMKEGELYLFPGRVTHSKTDIHPDSGTFYYLEVSFDPPVW